MKSVAPETTTAVLTPNGGSGALGPKDRLRILQELEDICARVDKVVNGDTHAIHNGVGEVRVHTHPHVQHDFAGACLTAVDGLIGVGKTTFCRTILKQLQQHSPDRQHTVVMEPLVNEALQMFYADPAGMAEQFQLLQCCLCVSSARLALIANGNSPRPGSVVLDRSPLGNMSFALTHHLSGNISDQSFRFYKIALASAGVICMPKTLHLWVPPRIAMRRIQKRLRETDRKRKCESTIPLTFLQQLDEVMVLTTAYMGATKRSQVWFADWSEPFRDTSTVFSAAANVSTRNAADGDKDDDIAPPHLVGKPIQITLDQLKATTSHEELLRLVGLCP